LTIHIACFNPFFPFLLNRFDFFFFWIQIPDECLDMNGVPTDGGQYILVQNAASGEWYNHTQTSYAVCFSTHHLPSDRPSTWAVQLTGAQSSKWGCSLMSGLTLYMDRDSVYQWVQDEVPVDTTAETHSVGGWKLVSRLRIRPNDTILFRYAPSTPSSGSSLIIIRNTSMSTHQPISVKIKPMVCKEEKPAICLFIRDAKTRLRMRAASNEEEHQFEDTR
jgi:hypothetical protein